MTPYIIDYIIGGTRLVTAQSPEQAVECFKFQLPDNLSGHLMEHAIREAIVCQHCGAVLNMVRNQPPKVCECRPPTP